MKILFDRLVEETIPFAIFKQRLAIGRFSGKLATSRKMTARIARLLRMKNIHRLRQKWLLTLCVIAIFFLGVGCQTFNLTEADFLKQQRGGVADEQAGDIVAVGGTAAYFGTVVALAASHW